MVTSSHLTDKGPGRYVGRFAPSPTGPLHRGSLVTALASWLDARAHEGRWLLRIEDLDIARTVPGAQTRIEQCLQACGLTWDGAVEVQSRRTAHYQAVLNTLIAKQLAYPCACSRKELGDSMVYPGTCRLGIPADKTARAWRFRLPDDPVQCQIQFSDRWQGNYRENTAQISGDFVLKRADGFWAYQLAVVVDDADQGITDVVRGADLLDSTGRQCHLQNSLGFTRPTYLHIPVVLNADGEKLSKQTKARAVDFSSVGAALAELKACTEWLELRHPSVSGATTISEFLLAAQAAWRKRTAQ